MADNIQKRVCAFRDFFERKNPEKLLGFFCGSEYPLFRYPSLKLPEDRPLKPSDFDIDDFVKDCISLYEKHEACGGDFIFSASAFWGIPWIEAMIGCPIYASYTTGSLYAEKPENPCFDFHKENEWVVLCGEMLNALQAASQGKFPLATTRMRGVSDVLAAVYGNEDLIFRLMDEDADVLKAAEKIAELYIAFTKFQLEHIPPFYGMMGSFYYHALVPYGTVWHQEDAAALLSPDLYEEFIFPQDKKIVSSFSGNVYHQHSVGFVPTQSYLNLGVSALELHIDAGGPSAESLAERYKAIQEKVPLIIWGDLSEADRHFIFNKLKNNVAVICCVSSPEEAEKIYFDFKKGRL